MNNNNQNNNDNIVTPTQVNLNNVQVDPNQDNFLNRERENIVSATIQANQAIDKTQAKEVNNEFKIKKNNSLVATLIIGVGLIVAVVLGLGVVKLMKEAENYGTQDQTTTTTTKLTAFEQSMQYLTNYSKVRKYQNTSYVLMLSPESFDMVANNAWIDITSQNVFFTLLIGLLTIYFINRQFNEMKKSIILIIGMVVSIVLMTDYTCYGVALIYVFYLLRDRRGTACLLMALMSVVMGPAQGFAALSTIPIMLYSGRKGPKFADTSIVKYGFYVVYPLHLLVIFMIKLYLIGIAG